MTLLDVEYSDDVLVSLSEPSTLSNDKPVSLLSHSLSFSLVSGTPPSSLATIHHRSLSFTIVRHRLSLFEATFSIPQPALTFRNLLLHLLQGGSTNGLGFKVSTTNIYCDIDNKRCFLVTSDAYEFLLLCNMLDSSKFHQG
ncbi:hypothetical protein RJT34_13082 [Clitoria ternatea]|uniref:Uncharacterized protein n=1 Tax=Clitoria ternatea TaxID=43366 RepID=A0AAN9JMZ3_CLITE